MAKRHLVVACRARGGCDYAFRIDRVNGDAFVAPSDATAACPDAVIDDSFDDGNECAPWGTPYENVGAQLREGANGLTVTPANIATSSAGCTSANSLPFGDGGMSVEVSSVLIGAEGEYTQLQLFDEVNAVIGVVSEKLIVVDSEQDAIVHSVDYDPVAMRWWRPSPEHAPDRGPRRDLARRRDLEARDRHAARDAPLDRADQPDRGRRRHAGHVRQRLDVSPPDRLPVAIPKPFGSTRRSPSSRRFAAGCR
jgi:hypothetical protein